MSIFDLTILGVLAVAASLMAYGFGNVIAGAWSRRGDTHTNTAH